MTNSQNEIIQNPYILYEYVPIGICIIDKHYNIKCWNKCLRGWTGVKSETILGKNLLEVYPHLSTPVYKLRIDLMFTGNPPTVFSSLLHKYFFPVTIMDTELQIQSATLTSIPTDDPEVFDTLIAIENETKLIKRVKNYRRMKDKALQEVSKRVEAEKSIQEYANKLEEINATKDKFFSIIAHDLKNPFAGFLGLTQILAKDMQKFSLSELYEFGLNLNKSANSLYKLLENLLDWARMQNGTIIYNPDMCVLSYLIKQNIDIVKEIADKKNIELAYEIPADILINADVSMLNSIFRNLISNAIKFTENGGKVEIGIIESTDDKYITAYVKDNGIGMSQELISKLFRIDKKVSRLGTAGESSTGLGLLLCKEFIEKHKGKLWVDSQTDIGSTFYFSMPIISI